MPLGFQAASDSALISGRIIIATRVCQLKIPVLNFIRRIICLTGQSHVSGSQIYFCACEVLVVAVIGGPAIICVLGGLFAVGIFDPLVLFIKQRVDKLLLRAEWNNVAAVSHGVSPCSKWLSTGTLHSDSCQ